MHVSPLLVLIAEMTAVVLAAPATPRPNGGTAVLPSGTTTTGTRAAPDKRVATSNAVKPQSGTAAPTGNVATSLKRSKASTPSSAGAGTGGGSKRPATKVPLNAQKSITSRTAASTTTKTPPSKSGTKPQQSAAQSKVTDVKSGKAYFQGIPLNPGNRPTSNVSNMFGAVVRSQEAAGNTNQDAQWVLDSMKGTNMNIGAIKSNFGADFKFIGDQLQQERYNNGQSLKIMPYIEKKHGSADVSHVNQLKADLDKLGSSMSDESKAFSALQAATTSSGVTAALKQLVTDTSADITTAGAATSELGDIGMPSV